MLKRRSMGMPNLSEVVFVRKFRWTVTIDGIPDSERFFKFVEFSKNKIQGQIYEVVFFDGNKWVENPVVEWFANPSSFLVFTTYDGCGYPIYKIKYSGLKLVSLSSQVFDYSNSDTSNIEFVLSFENAEREFLYNNPKEPLDSDNDWVENKSSFLPKSAETEETKVDTCCGTTQIPGKTTCCQSHKKVGPFTHESPAPIQELGDALGKMRFGDVQALQKYLKEKYELNARFF